MIPRADFGVQGQEFTHQLFKDFPISNLEETSHVRVLLRKPDFQRETNHWSPEQIVTFVASFLDNELIPALILWKSPLYIFVIDGGHRLSALRAWMADDYGDGAISLKFYGGEISEAQKKVAQRTRSLIENRIGRYTTLKSLIGSLTTSDNQTRRVGNLVTRTLDLQWVLGNAEVAETSFFKINSQGTPLDAVEAMLLTNRRKAIAIASRSILRAGSGHKYWSKFSEDCQKQIETQAAEFHDLLFDPEADTPIKTLDLPLGGSVSPVEALALLVDFLSISSSPQGSVRSILLDPEDTDGTDTIRVLKLSKEILTRFTGNNAASLGLHPAVYFYNERGVHSRHLFLGTMKLLTEKVRNNDDAFFRKFTWVRARIEQYLITNKPLITQMFTNVNRDARVLKVRDLLEFLIRNIDSGKEFTTEELLASLGFAGRVLDIRSLVTKTKISEETKSALFLRTSLAHAPKCPICSGLLYPKKSVSYDHKVRASAGGTGDIDNVQMVHPYCNSAIKN